MKKVQEKQGRKRTQIYVYRNYYVEQSTNEPSEDRPNTTLAP